MSKQHYRILLACVMLCIVLFSVFWLNERSKADAIPRQRNYDIAVILKAYNRPPAFWSAVAQGIQTAQREYGVRCTIEAPYYESDIDVQIGIMEETIARKPDAIILAACDYERLAPVCKKATDAGILLLTLDSDVDYDGRKAFIGTDNVEMGRKLAQLLQERIGDKAAFGVISHMAGASTATERLRGLLAATPDSNTRMTAFAYCEGREELARVRTIDMIQNYPEIKCLVALNESSALGAAAALQEMGQAGKIALIVGDSSVRQIQYLEDGTIQSCVVQNPFSMGYLSVVNAVQLLGRQNVPPINYTDSVIVHKSDLNKASYQQLIIPFTQNEENRK